MQGLLVKMWNHFCSQEDIEWEENPYFYHISSQFRKKNSLGPSQSWKHNIKQATMSQLHFPECFESVRTHHGVLGVGLLVVHLPDLLLRGAVDLTQHAEPLTVTMETTSSLSICSLGNSWIKLL